MATRFITSALESQPWAIVNNSSVNSVPVDNIVPQYLNNYLSVAVFASKPYAGALVHCGQPVPPQALPYIGVDLQFMLSEEAAAFLRCLEVDLKVAMTGAPAGGTAQNLCDFSSQIELYNGGQIQIDNQAATWADVPNRKTGPLTPDVWIPWAGRYLIDAANKKYSVLGFNINGTGYSIPATMQGLAWQTTNWSQVAQVQLQLDNNTVPAAFVVRYRDITLTWSDHPF